MIDDILKDAELRMNKSVEAVATEFLRIRTGRASTALLDHLTVDYYGSRVPIAQAATVSVGDARTLVIQAWEKGMIPLIEKAIIESDLGLNPVTAGEVMRIPMPALTEERRKEMTRITISPLLRAFDIFFQMRSKRCDIADHVESNIILM